MRHRSSTKHLGRSPAERKSLFKGLLKSLFEAGAIETTEAKAKAVKGIADKLIHRAQEGTISTRRSLQRFFGTRNTVNLLVDQVAPALKGRDSGYTRIVRLGKRRGDDSMMVKMELVVRPLVKPETIEQKTDMPAGTVIPEPGVQRKVSGTQKRGKKSIK